MAEKSKYSSDASMATNFQGLDEVEKLGSRRRPSERSLSTVSNSITAPQADTFNDPSSTDDVEHGQANLTRFFIKLLQIVRTKFNPFASLWPEFTLKYRVPDHIRSLDEYQPGYAKVASCEDCDPSFLIYRKFGWLHNRVLLHTQDELQEIEEQFEGLDKWEASQGDCRKLWNRRIDDNDPISPRRKLIEQTKTKLEEYDQLLFRLQRKQAMKTPSKRNQNSLYNLVHFPGKLASSEAIWIRQRDDLAAVAHNAENGWFNGVLEDFLRFVAPRLSMAVFRTREQRIRTGSQPSLMLVSPERLDILLRIILTVLASVLLLAPVIILFEFQPTDPTQFRSRSRWQVVTIFVSTLLFSASCSIFTKARRQEVFTATAAYCAVLVVFLGNASNVTMVQSTS